MNLCNRIFRLIDTLEFEDFEELIERWDRRADLWNDGSHAHNIAHMLRNAQEAESFARMSGFSEGEAKAAHERRLNSRKNSIRNCYAGMVMKEGVLNLPSYFKVENASLA